MAELQLKDVITAKDAMKLIGCSSTLFYKDHAKLLKKHKDGRKVYFDLAYTKKYADKVNVGATLNIVKL